MTDSDAYFRMIKREALSPGRPRPKVLPQPMSQREWRERYAVILAWSNPHGVSDDLLLTKVLLSSQWTMILSATRLFGADRMFQLWQRCRDAVENDGLRRYGDVLMRRAQKGLFE